MAEQNTVTGLWRSKSGGFFSTKEEADADEAAMASGGATSVDSDFSRGGAFDGINVLGNDTGRSHISPVTATQSNELFSQGFTDLNRDGNIDAQDQTLSDTPLGSAASPTATQFQITEQKASYKAPWQDRTEGVFKEDSQIIHRVNPDGSMTGVSPGEYYGDTAMPGANAEGNNIPWTGYGADGGTRVAATDADSTGANAAQDTADAKSAAQNATDENEAQNENLFGDVYNRLSQVTGGDYGMSDEARGYQKEGLQQQRMLLERLLGFDPNQYATQFADQALARQVAAGRSSGTSAAAQQAGMFGAMEQAPALYAEGARAAEGIQTSRLGQAEAAAKAFGELGTMTRNSDEGRQQFESTLQLEIGKAFTNAVQGKMQLNEAESSRMTEVWMNFAQLQSVYDKMSFEEQEAALDRMMQEKQLDQQWKMFKEQLKADGKITAKDIVGGLFSLGGGAIGALGAIGAAGAGKK